MEGVKGLINSPDDEEFRKIKNPCHKQTVREIKGFKALHDKGCCFSVTEQ